MIDHLVVGWRWALDFGPDWVEQQQSLPCSTKAQWDEQHSQSTRHRRKLSPAVVRPRFRFGTNGQFLDVRSAACCSAWVACPRQLELGDRERMDMSDRRCRDADDVL